MTDIWICPNCGADVESNFDVCWQCGSDREGHAPPGFTRDNEPAPPTKVSPSTMWTMKALIVSMLSVFAAIMAGIGLVMVQAAWGDQAAPVLTTCLEAFIAVCLCVALGSFFAFIVLCFRPLHGVGKQPPTEEQ